MIAAALASNVALSFVPQQLVFSWYVEAPVLIADTLWVSWALSATGVTGQEFFLLYFFILFLAGLGESLPMVVLGSTAVSAANIYFTADATVWSAAHLLQIVFFYTVALFYGHVIGEIKRERQRANRGFAWAKELEAKVSERTAELSKLYNQALESSRAKSQFVANVSHELRSPLNVIIGYAELLLDRNRPPTQEEWVQMTGRILEAAREQARLVDGVLNLGKVDTGEMPLESRPVRIDRFVTYLRHRKRPRLTPGVELRWDVASDLPLIETDAGKLTVVLDHLINNAIKFTANGSISVAAANRPGDEQIEFRVEDTGPGIDASRLPEIFEAFRQLDGSATRRHGGVGLGLTIVQSYVGLLGGEIAVRSNVGIGTSFTVMLPYRRLQAPQAADPARAGTLPTAPPLLIAERSAPPCLNAGAVPAASAAGGR
ncbi:MAG: sensor histidine kinase [Candidatus Binatia bacterium]